MTSGSTLCNKCTKKINVITTSGQSISNFGGDEEDDNGNDYHNYGEEFGDNDSVSQIGEKRTRKEAGLKVDEDDLREYNKKSTGTEDVATAVNMCTSKGTQQQQ